MKKILFTCSIIIEILFSACSSTQIISSWKEPNKKVEVEKLNKVLVLALFKDESTRHKTEDHMVGFLGGKGVVSYNYLDANFDKANESLLRDQIKADGFDAAVTMRLVDVEQEKIYPSANNSLNPNIYRNFSSYYYDSRSNYSLPGYYATSKIYTIETIVFSITENKIIWSGLTKSTNPKGLQKMTDEVAHAVYRKMIKQGFISSGENKSL